MNTTEEQLGSCRQQLGDERTLRVQFQELAAARLTEIDALRQRAEKAEAFVRAIGKWKEDK